MKTSTLQILAVKLRVVVFVFFFLIEVLLYSESVFWDICGQRWTGLRCTRASKQRIEAYQLVMLGLNSFLNESLKFISIFSG